MSYGMNETSRSATERIVQLHSKDGHIFYISNTALKLCPGLNEQVMNNFDKNDTEVIVKMEYKKVVLELFIDYIYYKMRNLAGDYETMEPFKIPPKQAMMLYKIA